MRKSVPKIASRPAPFPPPEYAALRAGVPHVAIKELCTIPGVGPKLAADLYLLGIRRVKDLEGRAAQRLFDEMSARVGAPVDPCVLYTFRCAIYFASTPNPDPEKLKWWNWQDDAGTEE